MDQKFCPIAKCPCEKSNCMFWQGSGDGEADGCLIVNCLGEIYNEIDFKKAGSLVYSAWQQTG